jgi:hypothetical protein
MGLPVRPVQSDPLAGYPGMTSVYQDEVTAVAVRHWRSAHRTISTYHKHTLGRTPTRKRHGTEHRRCWCCLCSQASSRVGQRQHRVSRGLVHMDVMPMRQRTGSAAYRPIGLTRRIDEILLSFRPWSLTFR